MHVASPIRGPWANCPVLPQEHFRHLAQLCCDALLVGVQSPVDISKAPKQLGDVILAAPSPKGTSRARGHCLTKATMLE